MKSNFDFLNRYWPALAQIGATAETYVYGDPSKRTGERWSRFTREEIAKNPDDSLDLGLIRDDSIVDYDDLPNPVESGEEAIANLEEAVDLLKSVVRELRALTEEK